VIAAVNKYDCWECCVMGMTMLLNETACRTDTTSRAALRGIIPSKFSNP
jgi:hypothetical protein